VTDRHTVDSLTSDALDQLYAERDQLRAALARTRAYAQTEQSLGNAIWPDDLLAVLNDQGGTSAAEAPDRIAVLQNRVRLANQARRAKEHQLDDIRRALCDIGFMEDDDPYSHADLADVIRQNGEALHQALTADAEQPARTTGNNPPGDRREQLPPAILALLDPPPYTSTACQTADLLTWQPRARTHPDAGQHIDRLHARCQASNEYTGAPCDCPCHRLTAAPADAAAVDEADLTGVWTPEPGIGCLNLGQPKEG
jgi:hypothetical protein